jgi:hypothetical protein
VTCEDVLALLDDLLICRRAGSEADRLIAERPSALMAGGTTGGDEPEDDEDGPAGALSCRSAERPPMAHGPPGQGTTRPQVRVGHPVARAFVIDRQLRDWARARSAGCSPRAGRARTFPSPTSESPDVTALSVPCKTARKVDRTKVVR